MRSFLFLFLTFISFQYAEAETLEPNRLEALADNLSQGKSDSDRLKELEASLSSDYLGGEEVNGWLITGCEVDKFNGSKTCSMSKDDLIVYIHNGKTFFLVGTNHFPRKPTVLKVDQNKPIYGKEGSFQNNGQILEQFKSGRVVNTRYIKWPYEMNRDNETSLNGFSEAYRELQRQYRN